MCGYSKNTMDQLYYAWREYLLEIKNDYQEYFDKEGFNYDLQAADETFSLFTNEELESSKDNKY